jgi:hypothetical protein
MPNHEILATVTYPTPGAKLMVNHPTANVVKTTPLAAARTLSAARIARSLCIAPA